MRPFRWIRSLVFLVVTYGLMAVMGILCAGPAALSEGAARWVMRTYVSILIAVMRPLVGIRVRIDGPVPQQPCIVAAKHQSFLDVMLMMHTLPRARFVMKSSILAFPVLGFYARRIGCIAIDRAEGAKALRRMLTQASDAMRGPDAGQLVIFPQGTRVAPGARMPYKPGVASLAAHTSLTIIPAATHCGAVWPRSGILRHEGTAAIRFLSPMPVGLKSRALMTALEDRIESASDALADPGKSTAPHDN